MLKFLLLGTLFGFVLSRVGATDYDAIAQMFLLEDLHLAGVIAVAIVVSAPILFLLRKRGIACESGCAIELKQKPMKPGTLVGGLIFGAGWALTGTCPGTALAQLGEGRLVALFTITGILLGAALYRLGGPRVELWLRPTSGPELRDADPT